MKKKSIIIFALLNLIIVALFTTTLIYCTNLQDTMCINIYFGESHAGQRNIAHLFYAESRKQFSSNSVVTQLFEDDRVSFVGA